MQKPRRPDALKDLGFDSYEFQIIGEIVVLCGLIEQILREMPLWLAKVDNPAAAAFTAHLNFQSLVDLNLTLAREFKGAMFPDIAQTIDRDLQDTPPVFEDRNRIVHGPFTLFADGSRGTLRTIARRKLRSQHHHYDRAKLVSVLSRTVDVYSDLAVSFVMLKAECLLQARQND